MVSGNICTATYTQTWLEARELGEDEEKIIKENLALELAHLINDRFKATEILVQIPERAYYDLTYGDYKLSDYYKKYELKLAVLSVDEYLELIRAKQRLEELEW
jgi:hypothetical protein